MRTIESSLKKLWWLIYATQCEDSWSRLTVQIHVTQVLMRAAYILI